MDDGLQHDTDLIKQLCEYAGMRPSSLAKAAGLAATTITRAYNGEATTRISQPTLEKLKATFPKFARWSVPEADLPVAPNSRHYVPIEIVPTFAGAGGGGTGDDDVQVGMVPRYLIEDEFHGKPSDFRLIDVRGDSMKPIFEQGDQLLIDLRDRDPVQPGPFALFDGDAYLVKLVERIPGKRGFYRVFSANERYSSSEVEETESTIMGRPVWFARRL